MTSSSPTLAGSLPGSEADSRSSRLAAQVRALRTRATSGDLERWLLIIGGLLMPLGVLFILLGWLGASRTPLPFEQNDYLISGGILGLALVFAGGFVYFAYWQTVRIRESREQARELTAALGRVEALLTGGTVSVGGEIAGVSRPGTFVATPAGSIFHRADCTVVAGRTDLAPVDPARTKLEPCRICTPLDAPA
jgi:multisubunit Na+/H+ antiporter MnhG subunit